MSTKAFAAHWMVSTWLILPCDHSYCTFSPIWGHTNCQASRSYTIIQGTTGWYHPNSVPGAPISSMPMSCRCTCYVTCILWDFNWDQFSLLSNHKIIIFGQTDNEVSKPAFWIYTVYISIPIGLYDTHPIIMFCCLFLGIKAHIAAGMGLLGRASSVSRAP